jgi:predicted exporter
MRSTSSIWFTLSFYGEAIGRDSLSVRQALSDSNEKADLLAKKAANQPKHTQINDYSSFSYIQRLVQRQKALDTQ